MRAMSTIPMRLGPGERSGRHCRDHRPHSVFSRWGSGDARSGTSVALRSSCASWRYARQSTQRPVPERMRHPAKAVRPTGTEPVEGLDPLLSADQVAQIVGVGVDYIWALCRANEIPHLRFGRVKRFRRSAIHQWLERREQGQRG